jgi:hypothetical protein
MEMALAKCLEHKRRGGEALKASTQSALMRWLHIMVSIPIAGYIYGPVADIPRAAFAVKWVIVPVVVLSGLWMWKGHVVKKAFGHSSTQKREP